MRTNEREFLAVAGQLGQAPRSGNVPFSPETLYLTGPVHVSASQVSPSTWNIGFTQYLKEKYGYQGAVDCNADRASTAKAIVASRLHGARAGNRKIADTQWKPGLTEDSATKPQRRESC